MGSLSEPRPTVGSFRFREGNLKEPIEGAITYLLLAMLNGSVVGELSGGLGTLEAIVLWITLGYTGFVLVAASGDYEVEDGMPNPKENLPDRGLALAMTAGGAVAVLVVVLFGLDSMAAWVNAISLGPGAGVPAGSSGSSVMLWVIIAIVGAESLSRGLDKLIVRYVWTGEF